MDTRQRSKSPRYEGLRGTTLSPNFRAVSRRRCDASFTHTVLFRLPRASHAPLTLPLSLLIVDVRSYSPAGVSPPPGPASHHGGSGPKGQHPSSGSVIPGADSTAAGASRIPRLAAPVPRSARQRSTGEGGGGHGSAAVATANADVGHATAADIAGWKDMLRGGKGARGLFMSNRCRHCLQLQSMAHGLLDSWVAMGMGFYLIIPCL